MRWPLRDFDQGSSPLTRGKPFALALAGLRPGLIPAHAGKTIRARPITAGRSAHPRSRGENSLFGPFGLSGGGSSPLTRGKRCARGCPVRGRRLIPAHAGKTCRDPSRRPIHRAHPRSRGENLISSRRPAQLSGSSPLTRGKRDRPRRAQALRRLIPAHAGKTVSSSHLAHLSAAHPRSRGKNSRARSGRCSPHGSSPLTRGKPRFAVRLHELRGLIPAHAGKTPYAAVRHWGPEAHPRSRGENAPSNVPSSSYSGSSPLTRGKLCEESQKREIWGLIPAHAGKTLHASRHAGVSSARPRSRGENPLHRRDQLTVRGSSPLTRGKLETWYRDRPHQRLIPAHAGKTRTGPPD